MQSSRKKLLLLALVAFLSLGVTVQYYLEGPELGFTEAAGDKACAAGDYKFFANSTTTTIRSCQNGVVASLGAGGGEANTASNLGGGLANWDTKVGVDLRFNSFAAADFNLAANLISIDTATWATDAEVLAGYQPLDGDLTSIAALVTTAGGRSILASTPADDQVYVGDGAAAGTWRTIPDCGEAGTLNYTQATNTFSCLTDSGGGGGATYADIVAASLAGF